MTMKLVSKTKKNIRETCTLRIIVKLEKLQ